MKEDLEAYAQAQADKHAATHSSSRTGFIIRRTSFLVGWDAACKFWQARQGAGVRVFLAWMRARAEKLVFRRRGVGLTIQEAIRSGRPFRRPLDGRYFTAAEIPSISFQAECLLASDWLLDPQAGTDGRLLREMQPRAAARRSTS